jgi:acyl-CoA reductase-like NAD-dependent aldehyde dehydrogenase
MMIIKSIDPSSGRINKTFRTSSFASALRIASGVKSAYLGWKDRRLEDRADLMLNLAGVLRDNKHRYAETMTREMGKPITQSISEVEKCAWTAEFFAEHAEKWLWDENVEFGSERARITFQPIGELLCVMPWNFPFWQLFRCAIPAMLAGNACLLRHSNVVPLSALEIEEAFRLAGFPDTFKTVITDHATVDKLIKNPVISGVSVTGSVEVGKNIAGLAGSNIKKFVLELGGSDPFVVLDDADINFTCKNASDSRLINSGQSCIAAKRFIVVKDIAKEFAERLVELMKDSKIGSPLDADTEVGPLATSQQFHTLKVQVSDAIRKGAKVECGGRAVNSPGYFFEPTVLTNVKKNMKVVNEEVFGPVASVIVVKDEEEAITVANGTRFGLGASVWTKDIERGERIARKIDSGTVFINDFVRSDPRLPFGGTKESGIGRELSRYGLLEFTNIKSIVTNKL